MSTSRRTVGRNKIRGGDGKNQALEAFGGKNNSAKSDDEQYSTLLVEPKLSSELSLTSNKTENGDRGGTNASAIQVSELDFHFVDNAFRQTQSNIEIKDNDLSQLQLFAARKIRQVNAILFLCFIASYIHECFYFILWLNAR